MLIDWFTVGAQAINFLILVWLLNRFLYRPVLAAVDAREKQVAAKLDDAAARAARAQQEREEFQRRTQALEREGADLLRKATAEAAAERQRLLEAARTDSQLLRTTLAEALTRERDELDRRLLTQTQAEVLALARDTLSQLAGVSLEDRMTEVFMARLRELPQAQKELLAADATGTGGALVRSAFEMPAARRPGVEAAVRESLGRQVAVHFETSPGLVCGVELRVGDMKLAWSVTDHLASIADKVAALIAPASTAAAAGPSAPAPAAAAAPAPAAAPTPAPTATADAGAPPAANQSSKPATGSDPTPS